MRNRQLVDPQPMETLPEDGAVFIEKYDRILQCRFVYEQDAEYIHADSTSQFFAWSYTVTLAEEGGDDDRSE